MPKQKPSNHIILFDCDHQLETTTRLKKGDDEGYMESLFQAYASMATPTSDIVRIDISSDVWGLSVEDQESFIRYVDDYSVNQRTHNICRAIVNNDHATAKQLMNECIAWEKL